MKTMILWVGVCLLVSSLPAIADQAGDEAAIRQARAKEIKAWSTKDLDTIRDLYVENAAGWDGTTVEKGLKKVAALYKGPWKDLLIKQLDEIGILFLTPDVAVFKSRQEYRGLSDETGKALPPMEVLFAEVYVKKKGKWLAHSIYWRPTEK